MIVSPVLCHVFCQQTKLWMFPEGTRNSSRTSLLPFKKGAFRVAITCQVPILPVVYSPYYFIDDKKKCFGRGMMEIIGTRQCCMEFSIIKYNTSRQGVYFIISHQIFFNPKYISLVVTANTRFLPAHIKYIYLFIYGCHLFYTTYSVLRCSTVQIYLLQHSSTPFCPHDVTYICISYYLYSNLHHAVVSNSTAICAL
jgi:hypothetical protein